MTADKQNNQQQIVQAVFDEAEQALKITGTVVTTAPVGGATAAKQDEQTALLTTIDADTSNIATDIASLDSKTVEVDTGNVTVTSTVLPTGAATEAKQDTGNTSLSSINGKIVAVDTGAVVVSSSALPTGAATEATLSSLNGKVTAVNTGAVVVASSALPTGASTETTLAAINTKTPSLGQTTMSASSPVTIASNQSSIPSIQQNSLVPFAYDAITVDLSGSTTDVYTYKTGGTSGTTVATVTLTYTSSAKTVLQSVVRT